MSIGKVKLYHAGDTDFIPEINATKDVEVALLPIGGTYTMDVEEATEADLTIRPRSAVPMHSWDKDPCKFKKGVESSSSVRVHILRPGGALELEQQLAFAPLSLDSVKPPWYRLRSQRIRYNSCEII